MIGICRRYDDVQYPTKATEWAVGYDLYAYYKTESGRPNKLLVPPQTTRAVPTGLIVVPPEGYSVFVGSRSGMAKENSLFVPNGPGIVDPDYRGELMVLLYNGGHQSMYVSHGDRVGQMIILPYRSFDLFDVKYEDLDKTVRGDKGFGSTGR